LVLLHEKAEKNERNDEKIEKKKNNVVKCLAG